MGRAGVLIRRSAAVSLDPAGASRCAARVARMRAVCRCAAASSPIQFSPDASSQLAARTGPRRSVCSCTPQSLLAQSRYMRCGRWGCRGVNYRRIGFALLENWPGSWTIVCASLPGGSDRINTRQDFFTLFILYYELRKVIDLSI